MPVAASPRNSRRPTGSEVVVSGRRLPLSAHRVRRVVEAVLRGERRQASISVTFLGREHPDDDSRTRSPMWRRQERYVEKLA